MNKSFTKNTKNQQGNALFLILIAVALFAALSYAVTQSGGGGGTIDREQSLISAAQVTQYPALLRTTVTRMVLTGTTAASLDFTSAPTNTDDSEVFGTTGGGVSFQAPPASSGATVWGFLDISDAANGFAITDVGTNTIVSGREVIAYADGITQNVCEAVRKGLGFTGTAPDSPTATVETTAVTFAVAASNAAADNATTFNSHAGEGFSCVRNGAAGNYVYYHALVEN